MYRLLGRLSFCFYTGTALLYAFAFQHRNNRTAEALDIEAEAHPSHIFAVVTSLVLNGNRIPSVYLRPARQSGFDIVRPVFVALCQ